MKAALVTTAALFLAASVFHSAVAVMPAFEGSFVLTQSLQSAAQTIKTN